MHTTINRNRLSSFIGRTAAVTFLAAAGTLGLHAQQSAGTAPSLPPISLKSSLAAPLDLSTPDDLKYSSSTGSDEMANAETFNLSSSADQPPPRRKYSRPNYNDSRTNSDGSAKYTFFVGGGFTLPVGGTHNYLATSYDVQAGAGRNFNKTFGVNVQFDWDNFGFQTATLNNQLAIYNAPALGRGSHSARRHQPRLVLYRRSDRQLLQLGHLRCLCRRRCRLLSQDRQLHDSVDRRILRSVLWLLSPTRPIRPSTNTPATPSA